MASSLRRSKWLKLDPREKWTTLRDAQRQIPKLMTFANDWNTLCDMEKDRFGLQPRFSPTVASSVAACTASWLRCFQDNHDIYARKKEPFAEMFRRGFYLHAETYPTRHVERMVDPHTSGYVALLHNDHAARFVCETPAMATVRVDLQPNGVEEKDFHQMLTTMPNCGLDDRQLWMAMMRAITSVLSALYIHQRVVDFTTDSHLIAQTVRTLLPHLVKDQYIYIREPKAIVSSPLDATTTASASESAEGPAEMEGNGENDGEVGTGKKDDSSSGALKNQVVVGRRPGRKNHLALRIEDTMFLNSWMVLPSYGEEFHAKEWTTSKIREVARYLVECDATVIYVDSKWPCISQLEAEMEKQRMVNGKLFGTKTTLYPLDDLCENYHLLIRTHMISIISPTSQDSNTKFHKTLTKNLLNTKVVSQNANALDVFALYPQLQFTELIGNSHRYLGVERTFLKRHFNTWGNNFGLGSAVPLAGRIDPDRVSDPVQLKAMLNVASPHILFQERLHQFWFQPYVATAIPVLFARYLNI